jgi:hypothetical protein
VSYTSVFGGNTIYPSDVSYLSIPLSADTPLEWPLESSGTEDPAARIIDVDPSASGFSVVLPNATLTGAGQTILFNNIDATFSFFVKDYAGNTLATVTAGTQWQVYLAATTTPAGTWRVFRYGASTATVQPSALAGFGLTVTGTTLSQSLPVTTFSTTGITVATSNRASAFVWTATGSGTLNLLTAASAGNNFFVFVRNEGGGDLTIEPAGTENINSALNLVLRPGDSATVITDGVSWYTIGLGQEAVFAFDYTSISVTGGTVTLSGSQLNRIAYKFVGTLTSNCTIVVPATIQQYWINNATTGPFQLFVQTSTGTPTQVNQGAKGIYYCDGTNMVLASDPTTLTTPIVISDGGTGSTTASGARLNLGITSFADAIVTATTGASVRTTISAAASGANSDITSLSGLTTPLSVPQGGTGATSLTSGFLVKGNGASAASASVVYDSGTNVGIGTNSPTTKLDVVGSASFGAAIITGTGLSTGDAQLELGANRTGSGLAYIDLHSVTGTDFEARFVRYAGANGGLDLIQTGTGGMVITNEGSADTVFKTNAIERMRITNAGNIGIGTASPPQLLAVGNTTDQVGAGVSGAVSTLYFGSPSTGSGGIRRLAYDRASGNFDFIGNSVASPSTQMTITAAGNVGIGTSSPTYRLDIVSGDTTASLGYAMRLRSNATATAAAMQFTNSAGLSQNGLVSCTDTGVMVLQSDGASGLLAFRTNNNERMRINSSGNVGIGTSVPTFKLDVVGVVASYVPGVGQAGYWTYNGGGVAEWFTGQKSGADHAYKISQVVAGVYTDHVTVTAGGSVGIGTTSPSTTLQVVGTVTATAFAGAGTGLTGTASGLSIGGNAATATTASNATNLNGQAASYYTDIPARLGYTPVQQGGGTGQLSNKIYVGWLGSQIGVQVDSTNFGATWPISINGNAATATSATSATSATTASTANALNAGNTYTAVGYVSTATAGTALQVGDNSGVRNFGVGSTIYFDVAGGSASAGSIVLRNTNSFTAMATFSGTGTQLTSLGVGTAPSGTAGEIRATDNVTAYYSSDARLKENVQPIADALGIVSAVGGKTFDWTDAYIADHGGEDGYFVQKSDFGVIAQDVEAVFPLAVRTREDGTKAVDYEKLVAVAFAAIAELEAKVAELQQQAVKVIK